MQRFIVIGITDQPEPYFTPEVRDIISGGRVFSGGKRHHHIVGSLLPEGAQWIDITVPLEDVFQQYTAAEIIVFASGDPLFFGFANTIQRKKPDAELVVYPAFNSLQMLAHRLLMPYHDMRIVSLTGRPWAAFDQALIEGAGKMGVLTDKVHTPAAIAQRMVDYGYNDYEMSVGEHLGSPSEEHISTMTLEEAAQQQFAFPNCLILIKAAQRSRNAVRTFGIPDSDFALLDGREKMITKMPIRLLALQALELAGRQVLWDIGFCTGSVSIEARRLFPHLQVVAFEVRPECEALIRENSRRHGTPGIEVLMGDFLKADVSGLPRPDAVFVGGHGGRLKEIMEKVLTVLSDDGIIVMNSVVAPKVTTDSRQLWDTACEELHLRQDKPTHIQLDEYHPITILKCRK